MSKAKSKTTTLISFRLPNELAAKLKNRGELESGDLGTYLREYWVYELTRTHHARKAVNSLTTAPFENPFGILYPGSNQ